jgi:hypothetical protein
MSTELYDRLYGKDDRDKLDEDAPPEIKVEVQDITETEGPYGDIVSTKPTAERHKTKAKSDRYSDIGLVIRRRLLADKSIKEVNLEIRSPIIHEALGQICGESFWLSTRVSPIVIERPYLILFHNRAEIREYAASDKRTSEEQEHMKLLTDFMGREFASLEAEYRRLALGKQTSFHLLWAFFRPDEEVMIHNGQYTECGVIFSLKFNKKTGWEIGTRGWDYNGTHFGPVDRIVVVKPFEGICDITTLQIYPSRFLDDRNGNSLW